MKVDLLSRVLIRRGSPIGLIKRTSFSIFPQHQRLPNNKPSHVFSPWPSIDTAGPSESIASYVFHNLKDHANSPALVSGDTSLSFLDVWANSLRFGSSLLQQGLQEGQVIAAVVPNKSELPIITLGATEVGISVAPICPSASAETICRQLVSCGAHSIVTTSDFLPQVTKAARYYGRVKLIIVIDDVLDYELVSGKNHVAYHEMISQDVQKWPSEEETERIKNSTAFLTWSDGTSHAAFSHKNIITSLKQMELIWNSVAKYVQNDMDVKKQTTALITVPASRPSSMASVLLHLKLGHRVVLDRKCPLLPLKMDQFQPSVYHLGPVAAQWIADSTSSISQHLRSLRYVAIHPTTAPLNTALVENLHNKLSPGTILSQQHTRSQLMSSSHIRFQNSVDHCKLFEEDALPQELSKMVGTSCGLPLSTTESKVVGPDGATLPVHSVGKLSIRGPQVMEGFWNNGQVDKTPLLESEGWMLTEDSAYCDEDGNTFLVDIHPFNGKISFRM